MAAALKSRLSTMACDFSKAAFAGEVKAVCGILREELVEMRLDLLGPLISEVENMEDMCAKAINCEELPLPLEANKSMESAHQLSVKLQEHWVWSSSHDDHVRLQTYSQIDRASDYFMLLGQKVESVELSRVAGAFQGALVSGAKHRMSS